MEHAAALSAPAVPVPFFSQVACWEAVAPLAEAALAEAVDGADLVGRFESAIAARVGAAAVVAVGAGPVALELLLRAIGVEPGDEVVVPAAGEAALASAVVLAGGRPVFADIGPDLVLDPDAAAEAITGRTRALVAAHPAHRPAGPAVLAALGEVADRAAVTLVEDGDPAIGPRRAPGGGALSFAADTALGALGDAGALVTDDAHIAETARLLRGPDPAADTVMPGANRPLSGVQAAVLLAKLTRLDADLARRAELAARYTERLAGVVDTPPGDGPVFHGYPVGVDRRAELAAYLAAHGVGTEIRHRLAVPAQPCFAHLGAGRFPVAESAAARLIALPLYPGLADGAVDRICELVAAFHGRPS